MSEEESDEVVRCKQCTWPVLRGQRFIGVLDLCGDCQTIHVVGVVHLQVCAHDFAAGEATVRTQGRISGLAGYN